MMKFPFGARPILRGKLLVLGMLNNGKSTSSIVREQSFSL